LRYISARSTNYEVGGNAMTILRIVNRGVDWDTYHAVNAQVDVDHRHPEGLIMHGACEVDGAVQIAQVWDSEEYARRFDKEHLMPALQAVGAPLDADVTTFELEHLVTP
jgi:hypothetical protein